MIIPIIISKILGFFPEKERILLIQISKAWINAPADCNKLTIPKNISHKNLLQILKCTKSSVRTCTIDKTIYISPMYIDNIIITLPKLQHLNLTMCNSITDEELQKISNLTTLQSLNLYGCKKITDAGLQYISNIITLQELNFCNCNQITDVGLRHISNLTLLQQLLLSYCEQITDEGLHYISNLTTLQILDLSNCYQIKDYGLQHISKIISLQH